MWFFGGWEMRDGDEDGDGDGDDLRVGKWEMGDGRWKMGCVEGNDGWGFIEG